jgi:hypothetical protein
MLLIAATPIPKPRPSIAAQQRGPAETVGQRTDAGTAKGCAAPPSSVAKPPQFPIAKDHTGEDQHDAGNGIDLAKTVIETIAVAVTAIFTVFLALWTNGLRAETKKLVSGADEQAKKMVDAITAMNAVAVETGNLVEENKKQVAEIHDLAVAAERSADTAVRALLTTERAFVFVKHIIGFPVFLNNTSQQMVGYVLNPMWTNSGTTPARYCKLNVDWCAHDGELPDGFPYFYKNDMIQTTIGPNSEIAGGLIEIDSDSLNGLVNRTKRIYIWGKAEYRDIFADTPPRLTTFCVRMDVIRGNGRDGSVFVGFVPYGPNNYTEKDT